MVCILCTEASTLVDHITVDEYCTEWNIHHDSCVGVYCVFCIRDALITFLPADLVLIHFWWKVS